MGLIDDGSHLQPEASECGVGVQMGGAEEGGPLQCIRGRGGSGERTAARPFHIRPHARAVVFEIKCMYVCMHICVYVQIYVCMYVCMYIV